MNRGRSLVHREVERHILTCELRDNQRVCVNLNVGDDEDFTVKGVQRRLTVVETLAAPSEKSARAPRLSRGEVFLRLMRHATESWCINYTKCGYATSTFFFSCLIGGTMLCRPEMLMGYCTPYICIPTYTPTLSGGHGKQA